MSVTGDSVVVPAPVPASAARSVQWGAVILGALGASAISLVLLTFGAGIGLSVTSAQPYAGASAKALAVISTLYAAVALVGSFAAGGYIAGRMRLPPSAEEVAEADFRDGAHGFAVWALAIVVSGVLAATGIAGTVKTAVQAAAAGAAGAASNPALAHPPGGNATWQISMMPVDFAVDRLLAPTTPSPSTGAPAAAATTPGTTGPAPTATGPTVQVSRADLAGPISRALAASVATGKLDGRDRTTLVALVMQQTGLPQAEAEKRVDDAYADFKAAEQKVRDAADKARKTALIAAFGVAATLLLACAAACIGASAGARHRHERTAVVIFGARRFW